MYGLVNFSFVSYGWSLVLVMVGLVWSGVVWFGQAWWDLVDFDLIRSIHRQTNNISRNVPFTLQLDLCIHLLFRDELFTSFCAVWVRKDLNFKKCKQGRPVLRAEEKLSFSIKKFWILNSTNNSYSRVLICPFIFLPVVFLELDLHLHRHRPVSENVRPGDPGSHAQRP